MMGHTTNSESDKTAAQSEQLCWDDTIVYVKQVDIDNKNIQSFIEKETYEQLSNEEKSKYKDLPKRKFNNIKRNNLMWVHKNTGKTFDREAYDAYPDKDELRETTLRRYEDSQTKYVHIENLGKKRKTYLNQDKYDALDPSEKLQYIPTSSREQNIKKYRENMQKKKAEQAAKNCNDNNNNASNKTKKRTGESLVVNRSTLFQSDEQRRNDDNDDANTRLEIEDIDQNALNLYAISASRTPAPHERIMLSFLEGLGNVEPRSGQELSNNNNNNANNNSAVNQSNQPSNSGTRMVSSLLNNNDEEKSCYRA